MKRINVSIRQMDIERLDEYAEKLKMGRSEALRRILDEYFEESTELATDDKEV